jgi:phenylpropionate dioxygenase-like ring-hydroxylating dioxygenase large terminal subunit
MLVDQRNELLLSDGTTLDELVSSEGERQVSVRLLGDPSIFELELQRIYDRVWIFVGHESELRAPGDFVTRTVGLDSVIVTRGRDEELNVLLNVCAHRATRVCSAERGSARSFECPYHGWVFKSNGELAGITMEQAAFPGGVDKSRYGLRRGRIETYQGLMFATWDEEAPSLEEYLGDVRFYLDITFGELDSGWEVVGPPQRWMVPANWKLPAENLAGDGYHVLAAHRSLVELGLVGSLQGNSPIGRAQKAVLGDRQVRAAPSVVGYAQVVDVDKGHSVGLLPIPDVGLSAAEDLRVVARLSGATEALAHQAPDNLTARQLEFSRRFFLGAATLFPNFSIVRSPFSSEIDGAPEPSCTIRVWAPIDAQTTEVWSWGMAPKDASREVKDQMRRATVRTFGSGGFTEQDDVAVWSRIQRSTHGVRSRHQTIVYPSHREPDENWVAPGTAYVGASTDDSQWNFYQRWRALMSR